MKASKKAMTWLFAASAFGSIAAACSDDEPTTKTTVAADSGDASESGGGGVDAFCQSADELAAEFEKVMADPASGDVAALTASATELTNEATALSTGSPEDAAKVAECLGRISTAMAGG